MSLIKVAMRCNQSRTVMSHAPATQRMFAVSGSLLRILIGRVSDILCKVVATDFHTTDGLVIP